MVRPSRIPQNRCAGFTLTELLVVVIVIGVLAALLMPVLGKVQNASKKVQVVSDFRSIKVTTINFYNDYRRYPLNPTQIDAAKNLDYHPDTVYGDPGGTYSSADLFNILRAIADKRFNQDNQNNPNAVVYWTGGFVKNMASHLNGLTTTGYTDSKTGKDVLAGSLEDPWGNPYVIWYDVGGDGDLSTAAGWFYSDYPPLGTKTLTVGVPPVGVACASLGPDGIFGAKDTANLGKNKLEGSDDVVSW